MRLHEGPSNLTFARFLKAIPAERLQPKQATGRAITYAASTRRSARYPRNGRNIKTINQVARDRPPTRAAPARRRLLHKADGSRGVPSSERRLAN
ncbi:hypothetical protein EVAR_93617_1 [Eumeta japonica]|uniref:Uncharacterized protein n=1 Tax=Eumeta variegata TaxID=151549 RepID=A0A4C1TQL7_EUMVA|nr:hypothetical protein EVAR_93617_1 [Eumeta japonica]